jgi:hypothetical protein
MLVVALVLALAVPIVVFALRDRGDSDASGQSLPISTYSDDKYRDHDPTSPTDSPAPSVSPTGSPSPTAARSDEPSSPPSSESESVAPNQAQTSPAGDPTRPPPPPPPADDGGMTDRELGLFTMIDDARVDHGCARLGRDTALTNSARAHAGEEAANQSVQIGDGTEAIADATNARDAFNKMMDAYSGAVLDCGRTDLGIGYGQAQIKGTCDQGSCSSRIERRWAADFD